jgi:hypothetical protein
MGSMVSRTNRAIIQLLAIFLWFGFVISPALHAGTLSSSIISMFPKDVGELGYADLGHARNFPWFPQFQSQLVPVSVLGFEQFIENAQVQHPPSIDQVVWARISLSSRESGHLKPGSGQLVAVAAGQFDVETIKSFLDSRNAPTIQVGSEVVYSSQTDLGMSEGYFALLDNETIAFGPLEGLKRILGIRAGDEGNLSQNAEMMASINKASTDAVFWGVLDSSGAEAAMQHLIPEAMKFPQANELVKRLKELLISVRASSNIEVEFQADSASPNDAVVLSQLLEAGLLSKRYQSGQYDPELAKTLDSIQISPNGSHLDVFLHISDDQMLMVIEHNAFSVAM